MGETPPRRGADAGRRHTGSAIRRAYDLNAARYHGRFGEHEPYRRRVQAFLDSLVAGGTLLDLGCGSGSNARLARAARLGVMGYDFSEAMLEIARRECPGGVFELADLRELPETGRFDALLASFCIVHLLDAEAEAFLARLPALMKPGAALYLSFMEGRAAGWSPASFSEAPLFYNFFEADWTIGLLEADGLALRSSARQPYAEPDGSTTTDVFLVFDAPGASASPGLDAAGRGAREEP